MYCFDFKFFPLTCMLSASAKMLLKSLNQILIGYTWESNDFH